MLTLKINRRYNRHHLQIIANYEGDDKVIKEFYDYDSASEFFWSLVEFRLRRYMSFRSIKLVEPASHRLLCEFKDYRYIVKQKFENYENYDIK